MKGKQQKKTQSFTAQTIALKSEKGSLKKYYYLLGLVAFFLFANTLSNGYNMDDAMVTINHKMTSKGLSAIGEIFTSPYYSDAAGYAYGYRPMVHLSFALEHDIFGEKPGSGHFVNIVLFALSVVLFFKLLVKLLGENNALFAGIATLLFAVHPIHTEVVASLKNRDEILAFLFVIWAGLSAHKFLEKGRWISLLGMGLIFTLAMLSKKSVYPMAIVIPISMILMKEITLKQLIFIAIILLVPAALIGSDLQLERSVIMFLLPVLLISFVFFLKHQILSKDESITDSISKKWIIPLLLIVSILGYAIYVQQFGLIGFTVPFFLWLFYSNYSLGIATSILSLIFLDLFLIDLKELRFLFLILSVGYSIFLFFNKDKYPHYKMWLLSTGLILAYSFMVDPSIRVVGVLLIAVFILIAIYKKPFIGFILSTIIVVVGVVISGNVNIFSISLFIFSLLYFIKEKVVFPIYSTIPILTFLLLIIFFSLKNYKDVTAINEQVKIAQSKKENSSSFLKEGRQLEYVENTLVAPHTKSEKIATGFLTLGEYLRLHVYPKELSFYYGYSKVKTVDFKYPFVIISVLAHLLLLFLAIWQLKKRPIIAIGVMWYLLSILLFSNWVELVAGMVGERLAFTASAGFCIVITAIVFWIKPDFSIKKPGIVGAILGVVIILFAGRTIVRNTDWKDTMTLMTHDIQHLQNSAQANNMYARTLMNNSISDKSLTPSQKLEMQKTAISHFEKAVGTAPDFFNAQFDLGMAARIAGEQEKAVKAYLKVIDMNPLFVDAYTNLIEVYEILGEKAKYLETAQKLLEVNESATSYALLARAYFIQNDFQKAKEILEKGLEKHPNDATLIKNMGIVNERIRFSN